MVQPWSKQLPSPAYECVYTCPSGQFMIDYISNNNTCFARDVEA